MPSGQTYGGEAAGEKREEGGLQEGGPSSCVRCENEIKCAGRKDKTPEAV